MDEGKEMNVYKEYLITRWKELEQFKLNVRF